MKLVKKSLFTLSISAIVSCASVALSTKVSAGPIENITVPANRSEVLELPESFKNVSIKDQSVARVIRHSNKKVSIVGRNQGRTAIDFLKDDGKPVMRTNVEVTYDVPAVKMAIRRFFPAEAVDVQVVNDALVLSGAVTDAEIGYRIEQITKQFAGGKKEPVNVINLLQIRTGQQVMLRVRIGEVQRGSADLGPQGITGDATAFDKMVDEGMVRLLAEPSLVAISGESAEFLSGGELPIPVGDEDDGRIDYKPYGVSVKFTPYVLSQNRIRLIVEPEVSELSDIGSIKKDGTSIPGITSRRAKTTVELAPGESFMIAGLIKDDIRGNVSSIEEAKDGIGAIFKGSNIRRHQNELVIAVTPQLVDPVVSSNIKLPTDLSNMITNKLEKKFEDELGNLAADKKNPGKSAKGLEGKFGHMVE